MELHTSPWQNLSRVRFWLSGSPLTLLKPRPESKLSFKNVSPTGNCLENGSYSQLCSYCVNMKTQTCRLMWLPLHSIMALIFFLHQKVTSMEKAAFPFVLVLLLTALTCRHPCCWRGASHHALLSCFDGFIHSAHLTSQNEAEVGFYPCHSFL